MGSRILVVEDNMLNMILVREILQFRGHQVIAAQNVAEARQRLEESLPDIVLLDIQIPGGGGEVVLREIRAHPAQARLPVIAVTAQAMAGDRERFLQAGFDGYLSKPIETRTFGATIEQFLPKRDAPAD